MVANFAQSENIAVVYLKIEWYILNKYAECIGRLTTVALEIFDKMGIILEIQHIGDFRYSHICI